MTPRLNIQSDCQLPSTSPIATREGRHREARAAKTYAQMQVPEECFPTTSDSRHLRSMTLGPPRAQSKPPG